MEKNNVSYYQNKIFRKARVLFVLDECPVCGIWKEFIERLNMDLEFDKRIDVVICGNKIAQHLGFDDSDDPMLKIFDKQVKAFPMLFIEGNKISGANSREEAEAFVRAWLDEDFIIPQDNKYLFNADCRIVKRGFFKRETLVCDEI